MKKKYIFFDIDGTLTSGVINFQPIISQETKQTLLELKQQGHFLAIATGRPYFMAKDLAQEVAIDNIVCNGGNDVYIQGECKQAAPLDRSLALYVIRQCIDKDIAFCVSTNNSLHRYSHNDAFEKVIQNTRFLGQLHIEKDFDYHATKEYMRLFIDKQRTDEIDFKGMFVGTSYQGTYVVVEPDDKYHGIEVMMQLINGVMEDVVVFGDGNNDIRMFQSAPCSIAMGNGIDELKEIASFVTHRSDEDGIRFACMHYGWL